MLQDHSFLDKSDKSWHIDQNFVAFKIMFDLFSDCFSQMVLYLARQDVMLFDSSYSKQTFVSFPLIMHFWIANIHKPHRLSLVLIKQD